MTDDGHLKVELEVDGVEADAYFGIVPEYIGDADVSANAIRLFWVLNRYANQSHELWRGRRKLMERCRFGSLRTLDRAMNELRALGAVTTAVRWKDEARKERDTNLYRLWMARPAPTALRDRLVGVEGGSDTSVARGVATQMALGGGSANGDATLASKMTPNTEPGEYRAPNPLPPSASPPVGAAGASGNDPNKRKRRPPEGPVGELLAAHIDATGQKPSEAMRNKMAGRIKQLLDDYDPGQVAAGLALSREMRPPRPWAPEYLEERILTATATPPEPNGHRPGMSNDPARRQDEITARKVEL